MSRPDPTAAALAPPCADASARARIDRQMATLVRLTEIGMQIAEAAGRRAAEGGDADATDAALSYTRVARAVRLTLALESRLAVDLAALEEACVRARSAEAARRRERVRHHVNQAIEAECADPRETGPRWRAAWERLVDTDDADLLDRPLAEVVAWICKDLGLSPEPFVVGFASPEDEAVAPYRPPPIPDPKEAGRDGFPSRPQSLKPKKAGRDGFPSRPQSLNSKEAGRDGFPSRPAGRTLSRGTSGTG